jgi:hypothetical protein
VKRKITMQKGYPTTDGKTFDKYRDAVKHQADIDLCESCEGGSITTDDLKSYLKSNLETVNDFIRLHLTDKKPAAKKKPAKPASKPADKDEAAKK